MYVITAHYRVENAATLRLRSFIAAIRPYDSQIHIIRLPCERVLMGPVKRSWLKLVYEFIAALLLIYRASFIPSESWVLLSSPPFFVNLLLVGFLRRKRMGIILDIRDLHPEGMFSAGITMPEHVHSRLRRYRDGVVNRCSLITTVNSGIASRLRVRARVKVVTVQNGYDSSLWFPSEVKTDRFSIIMHGNLGRLYDIETLCGVAIELDKVGIETHVIGDGVKRAVLSRCSGSGLVYHGKLSPAETARIARMAHVGVCLLTDNDSNREAFPVKVYEFIGAGLPVVLTPPGLAGNYVTQYAAGWMFASGDVHGVVAMIKELRNDSALYRAASQNARHLRQQLSRSATIEPLDSVIAETLGRVTEQAEKP